MSRSRQPDQPISERSYRLIGQFARFISALDEGRLAEADRQQAKLSQLGVSVNVRPLGPPLGTEGGTDG
jgi:hypothetical protein